MGCILSLISSDNAKKDEVVVIKRNTASTSQAIVKASQKTKKQLQPNHQSGRVHKNGRRDSRLMMGAAAADHNDFGDGHAGGSCGVDGGGGGHGGGY